MAAIPIALCITDLDPGGAERCLTALATRLDRGRFLPTVYCLGPRPRPGQDWCVKALEAAGLQVHCLGFQGAWAFPGAVRRLTRLLAEYAPRLVQTFLFHANIVGRIAARRAGVDRVVSGIRVAEPRRWHLWLDRLTEGKVDRHVCVSRAVADYSRQSTGLPPEKLAVIPNGVDVDRFPSPNPADLAALGVPVDRRVATCIGRLDRQKGLSWLLASAPQWMGRLPDCDLLLVGRGSEESRLRRQCGRLGIADRVHFAGWRADIPEILASSDLLLLPSRWEGMPNVVLEAMASRLPVVATRAEGVEELLGPAASRQTVAYGDSQALSHKIVRLMTDAELAAQLGAENRRRAEETFALDDMIRAYQDLWASLLSE